MSGKGRGARRDEREGQEGSVDERGGETDLLVTILPWDKGSDLLLPVSKRVSTRLSE